MPLWVQVPKFYCFGAATSEQKAEQKVTDAQQEVEKAQQEVKKTQQKVEKTEQKVTTDAQQEVKDAQQEVEKAKQEAVADPGGGLRGLKTPPSARPAMNKLTNEYLIT